MIKRSKKTKVLGFWSKIILIMYLQAIFPSFLELGHQGKHQTQVIAHDHALCYKSSEGISKLSPKANGTWDTKVILKKTLTKI